MQIRTAVKIGGVTMGLLLLGLAAAEVVPLIYSQLNKGAIQAAQGLEADLGISTFSPDSLQQLDLLLLPTRWISMRDTVIATSKIAEYQQHKQEISAEFKSQVDTYSDAVKAYQGPDLSFLSNIDIDQISFAQQRAPQEYLAGLKAAFREAVINYNTKADVPLRWELDPAGEIAQMSVAEKVGMLFAFPISGKTLSVADQQFLQQNHIGTVAYFGENVSNPQQLAALSQSIQKLNAKYPMLIATDQEGSPVQRLFWDTNGGAKQVAKESTETQCARWTARAKLLSESGVNWNLGIVADVTTNSSSFIYPRTFSSDYVKAAERVKIASECSPQVLSTLKHWPGHGSTTVDTHRQLGRLGIATEAAWKSKDYLPFAAGIEGNADSIMVGHLLTPWLDPNTPASLSKQHVDYLRNTLNYKGLIVTDDLNMLTASGISLESSTRQALLAGNDVLFIVSADTALKQKVIDNTKEMIATGEITEEDLNQRVEKVLLKLGKTQSTTIPAGLVY